MTYCKPFIRAAGLVVVALLAAMPGPARAIDVERVISAGGIEAWLVRDHANPIVTMRFVFRGGSGLDPDGREGLANMVSGLIDEGASDLDSKTFRQTLEDQAIRLSFDAGRDSFGGRLTTRVKTLDEAFNLARMALNEPRFDDEPVNRIRTQILAGLRQELEDPHAIGSRALFKTLYPDHPYGRPTDGTLQTVEAITVEDMRAFVGRRFGRDNLIVGVVGDITGEQLGALLDSTFGPLPAKAASWVLPEVAPSAKGRTIVIKKPVTQSSIMFAEQGLKREDPDYYAGFVMNHILGGGSFTSRLYEEVREKRGLVYSVYSGIYPFDYSSLILANAGTANERVSETLQVVAEEWERMARDGVTGAELGDAKTFLTGSFPLRFTSSGRIAAMLVGMQVSALGIDYLDRRNGLVEAVSKDDTQRVAKRLLKTGNLITVIVGQPEGVTSSQ